MYLLTKELVELAYSMPRERVIHLARTAQRSKLQAWQESCIYHRTAASVYRRVVQFPTTSMYEEASQANYIYIAFAARVAHARHCGAHEDDVLTDYAVSVNNECRFLAARCAEAAMEECYHVKFHI